MSEIATCRHCRRELNGEPYYRGKPAYIPETGKRANVNHFGGFVCSRRCDYNASLDHLSSMPGAGIAKELDVYTQRSFDYNWEDES